MSIVAGEVVPNPDGNKPHKVVFFRSDRTIIDEIEVDSIDEGERLIVEILRRLKAKIRQSANIEI